MSGGRVELGLGTGWFEAEHARLRDPVPAVRRALRPPRGAAGDPHRAVEHARRARAIEFSGRHYELGPGPALPKPAPAPHPPVIVGGLGPRRTPALAARFAAEYNVPFADVATHASASRASARPAVRPARDPDELVYSHAVTVCCAEERGGARAGAPSGSGATSRTCARTAPPARPRRSPRGCASTATPGASRSYLQVIDLDDLDHVALIAAEVMPLLAGRWRRRPHPRPGRAARPGRSPAVWWPHPRKESPYAPRSGPYSQRRPRRTSRVGEDLAARGSPVRGRGDQPPRFRPRPDHGVGLRPRRAGPSDVDLGDAQLADAGRTARSTSSTRPASRASSPTRSARCASASRPCSSSTP